MCLVVITWAKTAVAGQPSYAVIDLGVQRTGEGLQWVGQVFTPPPSDFPLLPGTTALVTAMNDVAAAGFSVVTSGGYLATLWTFAPGGGVNVKSLGALATDSSYVASFAYGLNERGAVVGRSTVNGSISLSHAFVWRDGIMTDLGTIPGPAYQSQAEGINDYEEIVGWTNTIATTGQLLQRAFVYIGGRMYNLTFYEVGGPKALLADATAIDCQGNIAASGLPASGATEEHSYLLIRQGAPRTQCPK
jgi:probable HAF family extracellular repeat protein